MGNFFAFYEFSPSEQLQQPVKLVNARIAVLTLYRCLFSHVTNRIYCRYTKCMYTFIKGKYVYSHTVYMMCAFTHYTSFISPLSMFYV